MLPHGSRPFLFMHLPCLNAPAWWPEHICLLTSSVLGPPDVMTNMRVHGHHITAAALGSAAHLLAHLPCPSADACMDLYIPVLPNSERHDSSCVCHVTAPPRGGTGTCMYQDCHVLLQKQLFVWEQHSCWHHSVAFPHAYHVPRPPHGGMGELVPTLAVSQRHHVAEQLSLCAPAVLHLHRVCCG